MHELCVLFSYYRLCPTTRHHYELVRWFNPGVPVVPIIAGPIIGTPLRVAVTDLLPNTVDISATESSWDLSDMWTAADTHIYRWFPQRRVEAKRYVFIEWDTLCIGSLLEFYAPVATAGVSAAHVLSYPEDVTEAMPWVWWNQYDRILPAHRPYASGVVPFSGTIYSHTALERICKMARHTAWRNVFSELRMGTLARLAGVTMVPHVEAVSKLTWAQSGIQLDLGKRCIAYHPIKNVIAPHAAVRVDDDTLEQWPELEV